MGLQKSIIIDGGIINEKSISIILITHMILWVAILLISAVTGLTYSDPDAEPLDFYLSRAVYNLFIILALLGIINAAVLFFSSRAISNASGAMHKRKRIAFCFSLAATIILYLFDILLFVVKSDVLLVLPAICLLCELCCGIVFAVSKER